jgi:hypothetical protein
MRESEANEAAFILSLQFQRYHHFLPFKIERQRDYISIQINVEFDADSVAGFIVKFSFWRSNWEDLGSGGRCEFNGPIGIFVDDREEAAGKFSKITAVEAFRGS